MTIAITLIGDLARRFTRTELDFPQFRRRRINSLCVGLDPTWGHLGDGRWWDDDAKSWRNGNGKKISSMPQVAPSLDDKAARTTKVVLAAAHLDHDPGNNRLRNLKAFCQRCHMLHDREEHQRRRRLTLRMRKALGDLFSGRYAEFS